LLDSSPAAVGLTKSLQQKLCTSKKEKQLEKSFTTTLSPCVCVWICMNELITSFMLVNVPS